MCPLGIGIQTMSTVVLVDASPPLNTHTETTALMNLMNARTGETNIIGVLHLHSTFFGHIFPYFVLISLSACCFPVYHH